MVSPRVVSFGQLGKGEKATKEFTVTLNDPKKVSITSVTADEDAFQVRLRDKKAGVYTYEVSFASTRIDRHAARLRIALKGAKKDTVDVPLRAEVVGNLRYSRGLYFIKRNDKFVPRDITVSSRSNDSVHIERVADRDDLLKLEIVKNDAPLVKVRASVREPDKAYTSPRRGQVVVYTSDADQPELKIMYTIAERTRRPRIPPGKDFQLSTDPNKVKRPPVVPKVQP